MRSVVRFAVVASSTILVGSMVSAGEARDSGDPTGQDPSSRDPSSRDLGIDRSAGMVSASADALFRRGRAAFDAGEYAAARDYFVESQRLDPAAGTLLNLALAEEKLDLLSDAWQHAQQALDALPEGDNRFPILRKLYADLDKRVPRLRLTLEPGTPPGTRVKLDGVTLRGVALGTALPLNPGAHTIVVTAPGHVEKRIKIAARIGALIHRRLRPGLAEPSSTRASGAGMGGVQVVGYSLLAAGTASLLASAVMGLIVISKKNDVESHCEALTGCDATARAAASDGKTLSTASTATFVAGLPLAATGVVLLLAVPDTSSATAVSVPVIHLSGLQASFAVSF